VAQGLSLHLGLNAVDPQHYQGWSGDLTACELDANDMTAIAASSHFKTTTALTKKATRAALFTFLDGAAKDLKSGDIMLLSYSGHGGQLPDQNGDEPDGLDETWCLYDGEVVDDEIFAALSKFSSGVRIVVFSDSCHSGSVIKANILERSYVARDMTRYRAMPDQVAQRTYLAHKDFYDKILKDEKLAKAADDIKASALLISGCQDNQLSADGTFNGLFTGMLKTVWNGGMFKGTYPRFQKAIKHKMPTDQTPDYFKVGPQNKAFENQKPFTV
jgi:hypothetical protein